MIMTPAVRRFAPDQIAVLLTATVWGSTNRAVLRHTVAACMRTSELPPPSSLMRLAGFMRWRSSLSFSCSP